MKTQKAVTPEGIFLQVDLKKLQETNNNMNKSNKQLAKEREELKEAVQMRGRV